MNEQHLCEFVGKWNSCIEQRASIGDLFQGYELDILDDLMDIFDGNFPRWVEKSATAKDGTLYYARYQWNKPYCQSVKRRLEIQATSRAQRIANAMEEK